MRRWRPPSVRTGCAVRDAIAPLRPILVLCLAAAGCVGEPEGRLDPGWVQIEPGVGETIVFDTATDALFGVVLSIPPEAVSRPTAIRVSVAESATPAFLLTGGGVDLHTPAIRLEPFNRLFNVPVEMTLPWSTLGVTVAVGDLRAWSSDGIDGIAEGLWDATDVTGALPTSVRIGVVRGGYYWAGAWSDDPFREADRDVGAPCLDAESGLEACDDDAICLPTGCMNEICAAVTAATSCIPSATVTAKYDCRCRCAASVCQWVR